MNGFPKGFVTQHIGIKAALIISDRPATEIAKYFHENLAIADALLGESYDKRFTPSTFIAEQDGKFRVGWFTNDAKYECAGVFQFAGCGYRLSFILARQKTMDTTPAQK